jgi:hypothetical protein
MQIRKEILFFYLLILFSAGVIVAAEQPEAAPVIKKCAKSCKPKTPVKTPPLNPITESFLLHKA